MSVFNSVDDVFYAENTVRFLVVDDEVNNRKILKRIFDSYGIVVEAQNGLEALEILATQRFDIILLDINMPNMNGTEVLQSIRSRPETWDIPVIFISALNKNDDVVRGLQHGANDYIVKPFDIEVVKARVETQLYLKQMMDNQKEAVLQLEAAQRLKDRLFRIASHDLKSPLANIKMVAMLLREYVKDKPEAMEFLGMLRLTVDQMNGVIEEFLDMSIIQSDALVMDMGCVNIDENIVDTILPYYVIAERKGIKLEIGELSGQVWSDPQRTSQAISNLVSNAIKYSPHNSSVRIWSEILEDRVRICVADQGPGIPSKEHELLFKEFSRLSTRPTDGESSTGLGLWIVKHMVVLQNGHVGVYCPPEGGSVFWIELAAYRPELAVEV